MMKNDKALKQLTILRTSHEAAVKIFTNTLSILKSFISLNSIDVGINRGLMEVTERNVVFHQAQIKAIDEQIEIFSK